MYPIKNAQNEIIGWSVSPNDQITDKEAEFVADDDPIYVNYIVAQQDKETLIILKGEAEQAEIKKLLNINIDTGTTQAAKDYRAEKARQGL